MDATAALAALQLAKGLGADVAAPEQATGLTNNEKVALAVGGGALVGGGIGALVGGREHRGLGIGLGAVSGAVLVGGGIWAWWVLAMTTK